MAAVDTLGLGYVYHCLFCLFLPFDQTADEGRNSRLTDRLMPQFHLYSTRLCLFTDLFHYNSVHSECVLVLWEALGTSLFSYLLSSPTNHKEQQVKGTTLNVEKTKGRVKSRRVGLELFNGKVLFPVLTSTSTSLQVIHPLHHLSWEGRDHFCLPG